MPQKIIPAKNYSTTLRRVANEGNIPVFAIKRVRSYLFGYDGYLGGCPILDHILGLLQESGIKGRYYSSDSPLNVAAHRGRYDFLDGGLRIFAGNYLWGDNPQGVFIHGFLAMRWILKELGIAQPRSLKGEGRVTVPQKPLLEIWD